MTPRLLLIAVAAAAFASAAGAQTRVDDLPALRKDGKSLYTTYCERCHGADGSDTTLYQGAKSLVDVTQRYTPKQIVQKSQGFAAVTLSAAQGASLVAFLDTFRTGGYAAPEMLVETSWVAAHAADPDVRFVDMRPAADYAAGHLPGAVSLQEGPLRNAEDRLTHLPTPEALTAMLNTAGIGNGTHVVAYDHQGGRMAARLWYVLNAYGHSRVSVVNGGWLKWQAEKRPISMEVPQVAAADFKPKVTPTLTCPSAEFLKRDPKIMVLDARSEAEFTGAQASPGSTKSGRVPGSVNVDWRENVTGPTQVFKSAMELRKLYEAKGLTPDKQIVVYCASGGRASHSVFALKLIGYPNVRVYFGSFADYTSRPDAPVEK